MSEMSLQIVNEDLEETEKSSLIIIKPHEKSNNLPFNSDTKYCLSSYPEESHASVDNRIDISTSDFTLTTKSEVSTSSGTKKGPLKEYKKLKWNNEFYEGDVFLNNLHGHGFFLTQKNGQKIFCDGLFYVNKLEGYNQIFYENGTHFQGLFKQHRRYGPGILTYPDGTQDVGFWNGFNMIRLTSVVGYDIIPSLVNTVLGKTKLLCYKYLVPLSEENDLAKTVFKNIDSSEETLENFDNVLNLTIKNPNSLFFHKKLFDNHFFAEQDCTIKVALDERDVQESCKEEKENACEGKFDERIQCLKFKIKEVNESLQSFLTIKESLMEKVQYCVKCCAEKESIEISETIEPSSPKAIASVIEAVHNIALDINSLGLGSSFGNASTSSLDLTLENTIDESLDKISATSSKKKMFEFCVCGEQREIEDLEYLEEQLSNITKQEVFYKNIRDNLQKKLNKILEKETNNQEASLPRYKLVTVTEVWAWNNEESLIHIQKHCFKHRNSEEMVNFSVPDLILGDRKKFGSLGKYEELCHTFLIGCSKGNKDFVRHCLRANMNPNLTDIRGNSGVFFATAKNQIEIISILTNFGAKLDQINDEGLTPLSLCLLKYLSQQNKCNNWEKAFLPETQIREIPNLPKWYDVKSFLSLSTVSSIHSDSVDHKSSQNDYSNSRILELFRRLSNLQQKNSSFIRTGSNTLYIFNLSYKDNVIAEEKVEEHSEGDHDELKAIHLTIMTLLEYGADPNVAEVPYPPLILSLFTENSSLVVQILEAKADINVLVTNDNISCLHIICSLKCSENNSQICKVLLEYKCDPNLKTSPNHWRDRKSYFTGSIPADFDFKDEGKNALHLLCMRMDFENDFSNYFCMISKTLIEHGIDCNETYLGHTPLSLAVLAGNIRLVKCLIKINYFNPYQVLQYNMGNILTLFTLKRFENTLPTDKCKAILTGLFDADVNVLNKVGDSENAIAFAEEGDVLFSSKSSETDGKKSGKGKANPKPKSKKGEKHSQLTLIKDFMKDLGRQAIIKRIEMEATEILYEFAEEGILENKEIAIILAEFLTPQIALTNFQFFFHSEAIESERLNHDILRNVLDFVNMHKKVIKSKKGAKSQKFSQEKKGKGSPKAALVEETMDDLISKTNLKKSAILLPVYTSFVAKPGSDDPEIYKVCFQCLRGKNKELKICPRCQMIYFCSTQCNKLNMKIKTQHSCNILFYEMTDEIRQNISKGESLPELAKAVKENCLARLHKKRESRLLQEELKLLEMWRADTYGTKFLEFRRLLQQTTKSRKGKTWNVEGLQKLLQKNFRRNPADFDSYCIDTLLNRLKSQQHRVELSRQGSRQGSRKSVYSGFASRLSTKLDDILAELLEQKEDKSICKCSEKIKHAKHKRRDMSGRQKKTEHDANKQTLKARYIMESLQGKFEDQNAKFTFHHNNEVIKKLRRIPAKYQRFIEVIGTYFPDIDISFWLLPYACCSNGQLFYKFCDKELFRESYSFL